MSNTVKTIAKSATRALGLVVSKFKSSGGSLYETFTHLFESMVQPVLLYGAALWGTVERKVINTVQNKACRFFLGVLRNASNVATRGDMGWGSVFGKQKIEVLRLWCRLKNTDDNRLVKKIFKWSYRLAENRKKSWEYYVIRMNRVMETENLNNTEPVSTSATIYNCKHILQVQDQRDWHDDLYNDRNLVNGNKLRTYRLFKNTLETAEFV